jgi:hypothetical protein
VIELPAAVQTVIPCKLQIIIKHQQNTKSCAALLDMFCEISKQQGSHIIMGSFCSPQEALFEPQQQRHLRGHLHNDIQDVEEGGGLLEHLPEQHHEVQDAKHASKVIKLQQGVVLPGQVPEGIIQQATQQHTALAQLLHIS